MYIVRAAGPARGPSAERATKRARLGLARSLPTWRAARDLSQHRERHWRRLLRAPAQGTWSHILVLVLSYV